MTPDELRTWLGEHENTICMVMDYEPHLESEEELAETLGYWFDSKDWVTEGQRFIPLGADGTGSQIAVWVREGVDHAPVVFFGSEGGRGVVAKSCEDWAKIIAHAPVIDEYGENDLTEIGTRFNFLFDEDESSPEDVEASKESLELYKAAVEGTFGDLPEFNALTADLPGLSQEFGAWIESVLG